MEKEERKLTWGELYRRLLEHFPNGEMCEDLDGQIVFYTGMKLTPHGQIIPFEDTAKNEKSN